MTSYRDCAVVYVASRQAYVEEAVASARSVRGAMPDIAIYLKIGGEAVACAAHGFDRIESAGNLRGAYIDKHCFLEGLTEERVLFLDTDTYVCSGLGDGFDLLTKFDLACAHAPYRLCPHFGDDHPLFGGIPGAFPELNTGVIFCRNTERVRSLFRAWAQVHRAHAPSSANDQPAFRRAVWESDVSLSVLPPEYNARLCFPVFLSGEAKILHFRSEGMAELAQRVNAESRPRTFVPED